MAGLLAGPNKKIQNWQSNWRRIRIKLWLRRRRCDFTHLYMAWISHLWVGHLRIVAQQNRNNCDFQSYCYADNWQSLTNNTKNTIALLNASAAFCRTCKMQLAPQKCWTWALTPKERSALAHCIIDGRRVPVADGAKDLGASITYNGKHKQLLTNNRIAKASSAAMSIARLSTFARAKLLLYRAIV